MAVKEKFNIPSCSKFSLLLFFSDFAMQGGTAAASETVS